MHSLDTSLCLFGMQNATISLEFHTKHETAMRPFGNLSANDSLS